MQSCHASSHSSWCQLAVTLLTLCLMSESGSAISFEEFIGYPFNEVNGYSVFPRVLDLVQGLPIPVPFPYFGRTYSYAHVSTCSTRCAVCYSPPHDASCSSHLRAHVSNALVLMQTLLDEFVAFYALIVISKDNQGICSYLCTPCSVCMSIRMCLFSVSCCTTCRFHHSSMLCTYDQALQT